MTKAELARRIYEAAHLEGEFLLRSGQISNEYFDKYRFESDPELLAAIAEQMEALLPEGTQWLAGLELGGVPLATALSLRTGLPVLFVRKRRSRTARKDWLKAETLPAPGSPSSKTSLQPAVRSSSPLKPWLIWELKLRACFV